MNENDFTHELERVCREKNVMIRSAFIRNIVIPEDFLRQKRERQIAAETKITNEAKEKTAESDAQLCAAAAPGQGRQGGQDRLLRAG